MTETPHIKYRSISEQMRGLLDLTDRAIADRLRCAITTVQRRRYDIEGPTVSRRWTDELDEKLRELHAQGHSCSTIARMMGGGRTRNSIIGRIHRLGLSGRIITGRKPGSADRSLAERIARKVKPQTPLRRAPRPISPVRAILCDGLPIPTPAETDIPRVSMVDLEPFHCRWVCVSDRDIDPLYAPQFCGEQKVPGLPYCEAHVRRAHAPASPRKRGADLPVVAEKEIQVACVASA